ncbi:hypothetical protein V2J09_012976 [Rumex salicifolius]
MRRELGKLVADAHYREALLLYSQLNAASLRPTRFTFPCLLKACAMLSSSLSGQILHTHIIKTGYDTDTYTSTALTGMYMKTQKVRSAVKVFDEMPQPTVASVNAAISGFSQNGRFLEAFVVFKCVGLRRFRPNSVMIASVLAGCELIEYGSQIHCWAMKLGIERDVYVGTAIVTMYMACGELVYAVKAFGEVDNKNVVSYNALMSGLVQNSAPCGVVADVFKDMLRLSCKSPNFVTLVSLLIASSNGINLQFGRQIHGVVLKMGLEFETKLGTSLVDMYSKCSCCHWAYRVFKEMNGSRNLITWNSMISGFMLNGESEIAPELYSRLESDGYQPDSATYNAMISGFSHLGKGMEAFQFFKKMQSDGVSPSLKSVTSLLPACSAISALSIGKEIHAYATRSDYTKDEFLATTLIDMYMKCGQFSSAQNIFDQFETKPFDPAFWNAMILGYGRNGKDDSAFEIFNLMRKSDVKPNSATFLSILSVCSHTGNVSKGVQVFEMMSRDYGIVPGPEHIGCMIGLLGRSGQLDKAEELIKELHEPSVAVLSCLLGASGLHLNLELGQDIAEKLAKLKPDNPTPFVMLSNMYAAMGRWKDVEIIRNLMNINRVKKHPGHSLGVV